MTKNPLSRISSSSQLYILALTSGKADIYFVKRSGASLITLPSGSPQPHDAARLATQVPDVPWAILVDQSEETFWGGTMPPLTGAAQEAWINRMADQSGTDSPYRWSQMQGKSTSQEGQLRVLGYTLGRPEALTPWLEALKASHARIRGVYAPAMILPQTLKILKLNPSKRPEDICVLVTPHLDGLRQIVMVRGLVRFSRLALHAQANGEAWFAVVESETAKLREYLIGNGLLKNDRAGMHIDCILPSSALGIGVPPLQHAHVKDRYNWISDTLPFQVHMTALAARQPWRQLAPRIYRKRDLSVHGTRTLYAIGMVILILALLYMGLRGSAIWHKQMQIDASATQTALATQQYAAVTQTFPKSPLTAAQLIEMRQLWGKITEQTSPDMRRLLEVAGQVLERHPNMLVDSLRWTSAGVDDKAPSASTQSTTSTDLLSTSKAALSVTGIIRGIASTDLRGTRDAFSKLEVDFNNQPNVKASITKRPLDLDNKSTFSGSSTADTKAELSFEVKLWQR